MPGAVKLLLPLLLAAGIASAQPVVEDRDGNGLIDYAFACDWDQDGGLDERDIRAAIDAVVDTSGTVELCEGTFLLDEDGDGQGEPSSCRQRPYVCIDRSGLTLVGQGPDHTRLVKNTPFESSPYIATNDGTTAERSSRRLEEIHVADLEIRGPGFCGENAPSGAKGIRLVDCDRCSGRNVVATDLIQSAFDFTRCTESIFEGVRAYRVGNYDYDGPASGDGACDPTPKQPCLYNFTSDGFVARDNVFRDVVCDGVGGPAINFRTEQPLRTVDPTGAWGEAPLTLDAATPAVAQSFRTGAFQRLRPTVVVIGLSPTSAAAGELRLSVWHAPQGEPLSAVLGYDADSFAAIPLEEAALEGDRVVFEHLQDPPPAPLAPDQRYAIVLEHRSEFSGDSAAIQWDGDDTGDLFEGGEAWLLGDGGWVEQPGHDLPLQVLNGWHVDTVVEQVVVRDGTGVNYQLPICALVDAAKGPFLTGLDCEDAGPVMVGESWTVLDAHLSDFSVGGDPDRPAFSVGALRLGPFARNALVEQASLEGPGDGTACVYIAPWSAGVTIRDSVIADCAASGISVGGGTRDVRIERCDILDVAAEGIGLQSVENEVESASRVTRNLRILRNRIGRTGLDGIFSSSPNHAITDLVIVANGFEEIGRSAIRLELDDERTGTIGPFYLSANHVHGWAVAEPSGVDRAAIRLSGRIVGLSMIGVELEALSGNEDLALLADMTTPAPGGDFWTVHDLDVSGDFGDPEPVRILSLPGKTLKTEPREPPGRPRPIPPRGKPNGR